MVGGAKSGVEATSATIVPYLVSVVTVITPAMRRLTRCMGKTDAIAQLGADRPISNASRRRQLLVPRRRVLATLIYSEKQCSWIPVSFNDRRPVLPSQ